MFWRSYAGIRHILNLIFWIIINLGLSRDNFAPQSQNAIVFFLRSRRSEVPYGLVTFPPMPQIHHTRLMLIRTTQPRPKGIPIWYIWKRWALEMFRGKAMSFRQVFCVLRRSVLDFRNVFAEGRFYTGRVLGFRNAFVAGSVVSRYGVLGFRNVFSDGSVFTRRRVLGVRKLRRFLTRKWAFL